MVWIANVMFEPLGALARIAHFVGYGGPPLVRLSPVNVATPATALTVVVPARIAGSNQENRSVVSVTAPVNCVSVRPVSPWRAVTVMSKLAPWTTVEFDGNRSE